MTEQAKAYSYPDTWPNNRSAKHSYFIISAPGPDLKRQCWTKDEEFPSGRFVRQCARAYRFSEENDARQFALSDHFATPNIDILRVELITSRRIFNSKGLEITWNGNVL